MPPIADIAPHADALLHGPVKGGSIVPEKRVWAFGPGFSAPPLDRTVLGGKGYGVAQMSAVGIPVPPGFILQTSECARYKAAGRRLDEALRAEVRGALAALEGAMGLRLGDAESPLLVSVLNLGCNDASVEGFARATGNARLAWDSYRRFVEMFADVVMHVERGPFKEALDELKAAEGAPFDVDLSPDALRRAAATNKAIFRQHTGREFPQEAEEQLFAAIAAVFDSWDSERAQVYRRLNAIDDSWGTAVVVQAMVFGNRGATSGTGVAFTRNPMTGEERMFGEFLINAQGEDVVAGTRTPFPLTVRQRAESGAEHAGLPTLEEAMPEVYEALVRTGKALEEHFGDMQDIEFTIDAGRLFLLQTRTGKRTGFAAVRIAAEMLRAGLTTEAGALQQIQPDQLSQLLSPVFDAAAKRAAAGRRAAKGFNAGPGAATGVLVLSSERAQEWAAAGRRVLLVREETSPNDYPGMVVAQGILTARGGCTSHAAVVARGMGKPCVVGCSTLSIDEARGVVTAGDTGLEAREGDPIAVDGFTGEVFFCHLETSPSEIVQVLINKSLAPEDSALFQDYQLIMEAADGARRLHVRTNADTPRDAAIARAFGAEGIGLVRTEHMFMEPQRLTDVRRMFFSRDRAERGRAVERLKVYQREDFVGIFEAMAGLPCNIRLLDPPLHEFVPHSDEELAELAPKLGLSERELRDMRGALEESNPMLGHRGCRLGIVYPEITTMQVQAILEAALEVSARGVEVHPEIMVPLVCLARELEHQVLLIEATAEALFAAAGRRVAFTVGTMIEQPRAALLAGEFAVHAAYFDFGTNDLTQTTFGISRDDAARFLTPYMEGIEHPMHPNELMVIVQSDPFQKLDQEGVGQLMRMAVERGRAVRPDLACGICGEHGGEPSSVKFCHRIGLDYVSCSPFRVPVARLAAAQAAVEEPGFVSDSTSAGAKTWL
eukprot:tig00021433_g21264.t1